MNETEKKPLNCPLCHRRVNGDLEKDLRKRQSKAGRARWKGIGKQALSEQMKRVRRGEKKNGIAA